MDFMAWVYGYNIMLNKIYDLHFNFILQVCVYSLYFGKLPNSLNFYILKKI